MTDVSKLIGVLVTGCLAFSTSTVSFAAQAECPVGKIGPAQRQKAAQSRVVDSIPIPASQLRVLRVTYRDMSFFDPNCLTPNGDGSAAIEDLAQFAISDRTASHVLVVGHADSDGKPSNDRVQSERMRSQQRAESGVAVLRRLGLPSVFLTAGLGYEQPARLNISREDKAVNRRLEFFLGASPQAVRIAAGLESPLEGRRTRPLIPTLTLADQARLPTTALNALRGAGLFR